MVEVAPDQIWMVVCGFLVAFILAFGIGANDVANSFGTSVGAKVLTLRQACILAATFETLGAILLGAKVSDTIRKGIIDIEPYVNDTSTLMIGNVAALSGSCVWLIAATMLRMPVSATHSIVGATVGFALVAHGAKGINWMKFGMIIGSWFVSPVLAGTVSTLLFYFCKYFILSKPDPLEPGLKWLPIFYATTIAVNLFSIFYDGPEMLHFDKIPLWGTFIIAFGSGILIAIFIRIVIVPWQRRVITAMFKSKSAEAELFLNDGKDQKVAENTDVEGGRKRTTSSSSYRERLSSWSMNIMPPTASSKILTNLTHPDPKANRANADAKRKRHLSSSDVIPEKVERPRTMSLNINTLEDNATQETNGLQLAKSPIAEDSTDVVFSISKSDEQSNGQLGDKKQILDESDSRDSVQDRPETARLFSFLQILTAVFGAFAHGGNDVSNAIGPLVSLWLIGTTGVVSAKAATPIWILFYGGVGISIGLFVWGRRVIKTLGEDLTKITPSSGFCIEIGSALTVLLASNIGIPISTTHCKVGSVVFVGRFRARENVDWHIFRNIVLAWLVTLPITGGISAALMAGLQLTI